MMCDLYDNSNESEIERVCVCKVMNEMIVTMMSCTVGGGIEVVVSVRAGEGGGVLLVVDLVKVDYMW